MTKDAVMYYRVFSHCLEPDRNWYAYNYCLAGSSISNRNNSNKYILQCFPHEFKRVNIKDLRDCNGNPVPFRWFNAGRKISEAYVVSSFGILTFAMRQRTLDGAWLQSSVFQHIRQMVNSLPLEEIGANTTPSVALKNNERDETARMIEHIRLLENRLKDEQKRVQTFETASRLYEREQCDLASKVPAQMGSPLSTSMLIDSNDITPPEKKQRLEEKEVRVTEALKDVAVAHHEDIFSVLGNLASQNEKSEAADIIKGTTRIVFSCLGAKKAFNLIIPPECQEAFVDNICLPEWQYLLLKLKSRISDQGWQTLLNMSQLGRSMVSLYIYIQVYYFILMVRLTINYSIFSYNKNM